MDDLEFIKKFSKVNISKACKKANVNRGNLYNGNVKKEKIKLVRRILEDELARLYLLDKGE